MSEQQNLRMIQTPAWGAGAREDAWVEDYLDHLCAPLVGIVPLAERRNLRAEVRGHLEALADEYGFQGRQPAEATAAALKELGEPWQVGQTFLREWLQGSPSAAPARLTRAAALRAFAFFGVAAVLNWWIIEHRALDVASAPDLTPWVWLLAAVSPLVAGALTALAPQPRMGRGLCWALGGLFLHALLAGLLLPSPDGFGFALCLGFWWLPAGWLSATATTHLVRSHRRQRFLRYAL